MGENENENNLISGQGESLLLNIKYNDAQGVPVPLTGHIGAFLVVVTNRNRTYRYSGTFHDPGVIRINVSDEVTALWPLGKHEYRIEFHGYGGEIKWLSYGELEIVR